MNKIYLHIGLHKTATKYFQYHVFPFLDKDKFIYNPEKLTQYMMDVLKADDQDVSEIIPYLRAEIERLNKSEKVILISRECMSGDLFKAYEDWEHVISLLYRCFPAAKIVMSMRYQPDWLVSCYRESFHEHHYQTITRFLTYNETKKRFEKPLNPKNDKGYVNIYALNLDYERMLEVLFSRFGKSNVYTIFYEKFKENRDLITAEILNFVGSGPVICKPMKRIPNRGYSAFSIYLSLFRYRILKMLCLDSILHRPIFFYGENSIPAGKMEVSLLDKGKYWGSQFKRDNEEVRSPDYPDLKGIEALKMMLSWRSIVKKGIDRLFYLDWNLLGKMKPILDEEYRNINEGLLRHFDVEKIPVKYLKEKQQKVKK